MNRYISLCADCADKFDLTAGYGGFIGSCANCNDTTRTAVNIYRLVRNYADDLTKFNKRKEEESKT